MFSKVCDPAFLLYLSLRACAFLNHPIIRSVGNIGREGTTRNSLTETVWVWGHGKADSRPHFHYIFISVQEQVLMHKQNKHIREELMILTFL